MHKSRSTFFFTLFLCSLLQTVSLLPVAQANVSDIELKHYSVADGLSQGTITDIIEDQNGFIWVATTNGLNRYDGYDFAQYHDLENDATSLPDEYVRKIYIDRKKSLWFGTLNGLAKYIPEIDAFETYNTTNSSILSNQIWTIGELYDGSLLTSDEVGLYVYAPDEDTFLKFEPEGESVPAAVRLIHSEKNRTWLGSNGNGVFMLDNETNVLYDLNQPNPWNIDVDVQYLFDIKIFKNNYWLATEKGVFVYSAEGALLTHYFAESTPAIAGNMVRSIEQTVDGNIWLGTSEGISIVSPDDSQIFTIDQTNDVHVGLSDRFIVTQYTDSKGSIWLGTFASGLHQFNERFSNIKHFQSIPHSTISLSNNMVWALKENLDGNIWIATQSGGINLFNPEKGMFSHFLSDFEHTILDLVLDDAGKIYVATSNGVFVFVHEENQLKQIAHLFSGQLVDSLSYFSGKIWIWSVNGKLSSIEENTLEKSIVDLPNQNVTSVFPIFHDSQNNLWLKTNIGLILYNFNTKQFNQLIFNIENKRPYYLNAFERNDAFWISTSNEGLLKLDKQSYRLIDRITNFGNVTSTKLTTTLEMENSIWLAASNKLIQVSFETNNIMREITNEMLEFNDINEGAGLLTKSGKVLFGGNQGFHIFDPSKLESNVRETNTSPTFTRFSVFNQPVTPNADDQILSRPIYLSDSLSLENKASQFSIEFAQLNPVNPKSHTYRYRMNGLSEEWITTNSENRVATFTNLMFGSYEFQVQSKYGNGPWSPTASLEVVVKAPLWLHRNAIVLYGFFLFLLLAYWFKQYKAKRASQIAIQESEERLKLTLWSSGDELWDWDIYRGQVFRANTWGTLDFPQDNIRANSSYQANIHADDIPKVQEALNQHMKDDTDHFQVTYRAKTFKGEWIWLLDRGKVVRRDTNNQPLRMTGTLKNISHLKQAEEQLKLFKRSIETISDGVFIADTTFKFISVNQSYCDYTGETREQALASYLTFHQYPEAFTDEVKKSLQQKGNWFGEVESRRANGEKYEMELNIDAVQGEDGKISHYVGVFSDITSRKSTEKELLKLANTDPLTEMPNRSFFQASHGNLVRKSAPHALLCLDMDNFKKINDSLGHQTGDILIKQIGKRLQKISGINSTCYRLGGDEFSILIDNTTDMHRITHFAQRILDDMARPFLINKQEFVLGASVGIAFYPEDGSSPQELLKNADTAMYFAKNAGGNKYQFFSGEMNQNAVRQLQIENLIRHGLKEDLFTVFYQPKVDIASGKLVSMEALVRFEHPEKGIVSPSQFIPLAEETGQIIEIGERVMQKACEDTKRWVQQGLFTGRVAVNISARQFELPDLDDRINAILQKVGLSALHLECEITEGTLMQNPDQALRMMERLRERGIHLALDDFGTGYSSLAYLKQFPLNTLKIDKAFIDDIATSSVDKHMTAAIINIAHNLGLKVVAEGVEQEKQLSILRRYDCEMLQGYLYSKPLSSPRFERLLKENLQLTQLMNTPT